MELEELCRREHPRLVRLLHLYCGDLDTAEDLAQETLARVWLNWSRVRGLDAPELWTRPVALNLAASWWRRRRTASRPAPAAPSPGSEHEVDETRAALAALARRQREVVLLRFYEDLSVTDTARLMRCREGTVKALTSQALASLRRRRLWHERPRSRRSAPTGARWPTGRSPGAATPGTWSCGTWVLPANGTWWFQSLPTRASPSTRCGGRPATARWCSVSTASRPLASSSSTPRRRSATATRSWSVRPAVSTPRPLRCDLTGRSSASPRSATRPCPVRHHANGPRSSWRSTGRAVSSMPKDPPDATAPTAGGCSNATEITGDVSIADDMVPSPRCLVIAHTKRLSVANHASHAVTATLGADLKLSLRTGETGTFPGTVGDHLEPGVHRLRSSETSAADTWVDGPA